MVMENYLEDNHEYYGLDNTIIKKYFFIEVDRNKYEFRPTYYRFN